MSVLIDLLIQFGPMWGWLILFVWGTWQLYCPLPNHTTKLQAFHDDFSGRLQRIELTQIALAEEVANIDEQDVRDLHGEESLRASDLKKTPRRSD